MLNKLIFKVTKFQLPPAKRLGTVVKNILGGHHAPPPPCQIGLRLDIVDFIKNFNSQFMQLTRFKILEFKRLFPLLRSTKFWDQPDEISLFVSCFFLCTHEQFTIDLKYSRNRTYSCHLTPLYINFRSDTYKLYPRYLLADVLKMCKTARQEAVYELGFSSLEVVCFLASFSLC